MTKIKAFITHKMAEKYEDCQDSFNINSENRAIAVADGVSQSIFPKQWADLLTSSFVRDKKFSLTSEGKVKEIRASWFQFFKKELERQQKANSPIVWHLENCFNVGKSAGATLVGIRIKKSEKIWSPFSSVEYEVEYEVLGDSCLIVVKDDAVKAQISSKPDGAEFDNYPDYIDSNITIGMKGTPKKGKIGHLSNGDKLLLVTDALSDKFNEERNKPDKGKSFIKQINKIANDADFVKFVDDLRKEGMSNDDTTLVCIELDKNENFEIVYETPLNRYIEEEKENTAIESIQENEQLSSDTENKNETDNLTKLIEVDIESFVKHVKLLQITQDKLISYFDTHKGEFIDKILKRFNEIKTK
ncbi:MAG: protein phosphatase 2C domain-containing protein [Prevotellaceae bacterium]|jgi:serine/threonine protein phosphatase PrpC|nr:protein phosphatase 2C domain-containing protein [Prevotellaceae bacterium]